MIAKGAGRLVALPLLVQGYLNQDWPDEYADPWAAVMDFVRREPQLGPELPIEIHGILSAATEDELRDLLQRQLDSGYLPEVDGWSYRDWLLAVAARVADELPA